MTNFFYINEREFVFCGEITAIRDALVWHLVRPRS
jgi:hypothetical protein